MTSGPGGRVVFARLSWLYRVGGAAALIVTAVLLVGLLGLVGTALQPDAPNGWSLPLQNNWLVVIFKLLAGFGGDQLGQLHVVNGLDIAILVLVGLVCLSLFAALRRDSIIWLVVLFVAAISPFTGIALFLATGSGGRTGVLGSVLIISIIMLRSAVFPRRLAYTGIVAGALLATGDVCAGLAPSLTPPVAIVAALFGIGYLLLIPWLFLVARSLHRLDQEAPSMDASCRG
jgi:hypothetical protein